MAKYDPLRDYIRKQKLDAFELTFAEMERRIGYMLPKSASRPQWWANTTDPETSHVQRKAWGDAGFDAFLIVGADRVRFRRVLLANDVPAV
jgi:hypothetical protein